MIIFKINLLNQTKYMLGNQKVKNVCIQHRAQNRFDPWKRNFRKIVSYCNYSYSFKISNGPVQYNFGSTLISLIILSVITLSVCRSPQWYSSCNAFSSRNLYIYTYNARLRTAISCTINSICCCHIVFYILDVFSQKSFVV